MKGLEVLDRVNGRNRSSRRGNGGSERLRSTDVDMELDDELEEPPYEVRMRRPVMDLALRVGLWVAVGFGCLGGLLAMVGLTGREGDTVIQEAPPGGDVPAPVARVAERAVEVWLTADSADDPLLGALFVEQPALRPIGPDEPRLAVGRVTTVAGGQWEEDYWLVKVAVEVAECVPEDAQGWVSGGRTDDGAEETGSAAEADSSPLAASLACEQGEEPTADPTVDDEDVDDEAVDGVTGENYDGIGPDGTYQGDDASADEAAGEDSGDEESSDGEAAGPRSAQSTTLYVEVGVVGQLDERVAALTTPSVVAPPTVVSHDWESTGRDAEAPDGDEPVARVVEGFLDGWLVGGDDPSLYAAAGVEVSSVEPAPFADVALTEIAYIQEEAGTTEVRAFVDATTPGGTTVTASYELSLAFREDRWEVTGYWGAPSIAGRPAEDADPGDAPEAGGDEDVTDGGGGEGS